MGESWITNKEKQEMKMKHTVRNNKQRQYKNDKHALSK